ncbi:MAG: hypothetical protein LBI16_01380 [Burkholderiales bacterium]|jgi:type IV pilus assembly protein PilY1|nr:hypothetical protein [Burkholderiales bacterium]
MKNGSYFFQPKRSGFRSGSLLLVLGLLFPGYLSAQVRLSDVPLGTEARVPPTIVMVADNSGSMRRVYTPDDIDDVQRACLVSGSLGRCAVTVADSASIISPAEALCQRQQPPMLAAAFNGMAYDPLVDYAPPPGFQSFSTPALWESVRWDNPNWTEADGRPVAVNLTEARCAYTAQQINDLNNYYMRNSAVDASPTVLLGATRSAPLLYYRTSVKWCNATRTVGPTAAFEHSANPGAITITPTGVQFANCQDERHDGTTAATRFIFPYFYSYWGENDGDKADNTKYPAFEMVVLDPVNVTVNGQASIAHHFFDASKGNYAMKPHLGADGRPDNAGFTRTAQEEITNYANWAAYYRNRSAATKTVIARAFNDVINADPPPPVIPRVTFTTIQYSGGTLAAPAEYTDVFLERIYSYNANNNTPLRTALWHTGNRFATNTGGNFIKYACQRSAVIMFTDGLWNDDWTGVGNVDGGSIGNLPDAADENLEQSKKANSKTVYGGGSLAVNNDWPYPIHEGAVANNTLADIALHYWRTRLGGIDSNTVLPTNRDPATWPHLNFYGMGFGVKGELPSRDQENTLRRIRNREAGFDWPRPASNAVSTVDDLWHASINGFGRYVAATSPDEFRGGLRSILNEILNLGGARSASAFANRNVTASTDDSPVYNYAVSFSSGWNGDVIRRKVAADGKVGGKEGNSAAENLSTLLTATTANPTPWFSARRVFTRKGGERTNTMDTNAVPFRYGDLTTTQRGFLGSNQTAQESMIAYLRGARTNEGDALGRFRVRGTVGPLGDIVDAAPVIVKASGWNYDETTNVGYAAFTAANQSRGTMVYVAANDGMLHAFDATLNERWAYVPMDIIRDPAYGGIAALSRQESEVNHPFKHLFYVNATPRAMDVKIGSAWKTLLIGGLGKGGTSYYALDVSDSGAIANEAVGAQAKSLWEFTNGNMGYTFGRPILTKTNAWPNPDSQGETKWVAILPSGYNNGAGNGQPKNGDGKAHLSFVDLGTGKEIHNINTTEGTGGIPLEMVSVGGYVEDAHNQLVTAVYGGDQKGNLWRFNVESSKESDWNVKKMAILEDGSGSKQYVTTEPWPQLTQTKAKRFVLVGTGGFRNDDDLTATSPKHTFYAFRDHDHDPATAGSSTSLKRGAGSGLYGITGISGVPEPKPGEAAQDENGWYEDMDNGFHVNLNPQSAYHIVVWAANKYIGNVAGNMSGDLCNTAALEGRLYARTVEHGKPALGESVAGAGDGTKRYVVVPKGIAGFTLVIVKGKDGKPRLTVAIDDTEGGTRVLEDDLGPLPEGTGAGIPRRLNIRFIDDNL